MTALEFHMHTDFWDRFPTLSDEAITLYFRCGNWTARHDADGIVPGDVPATVDYTPASAPLRNVQQWINELCGAGVWEPLPNGDFRMLHGPSDDWDAPLPLWRYSAPGLPSTEVLPGYHEFDEPDE